MKRNILLSCVLVAAWISLGGCGGGGCGDFESHSTTSELIGPACSASAPLSRGDFSNPDDFNGNTGAFSGNVTVVNPAIPGAKYSIICRMQVDVTRVFTIEVPSLAPGEYPISIDNPLPAGAASLVYFETLNSSGKQWQLATSDGNTKTGQSIVIGICPNGNKTISLAGENGGGVLQPDTSAGTGAAGSVVIEFVARLP